MKSVTEKPPRLTRQYFRDRKWVSEHMQELIKKYPNQWIMVQKGKVIAHGDEVFSIWAKADELGLGQPYLRFIDTNPIATKLLLHQFFGTLDFFKNRSQNDENRV